MARLWVLLPICMFGGSFIQGLGFYFLAMLLPFLVAARSIPRRRFTWLSATFLGIFFLFPLGSALIYWGTQDPTGDQWLLPLASMLKTPVSSVVGGSGLLMLLLLGVAILVPRQDSSVTSGAVGMSWAAYFHIGLAMATGVLLVYVFAQHLSGFDYREADGVLSTQKRLASGSYRALGFYGHPLSLASVALAMFTYHWAQVWMARSSGRVGTGWMFSRWFYGCLAVAHLAILAMTGSRAPLAVGLVVAVAMPILSNPRRLLRRAQTYWILAGVMLLGGALGSASGILSRYQELWLRLQSNSIDRLKFWYVHWMMFLDRPWFGQGYQQLRHGIRENYYQEFGYEMLTNKYNAHNIYLECLATVGLIGSLVLLVALVVALKHVRILVMRSTQARLMLGAWCVAVVANGLHGLAQNTFFDSNLVYVYWTLLWVILWIGHFGGEPSALDKKLRRG